jgi:exodeoxyribonuclease V gamma subunit
MFVYRSNRVEALLPPLMQLLQRPLGGPFDPQVVVVHSKGMERWLAMQIGQSLGICANLEFPFPGKVVHQAFQAALGERADGLDAWQPDALTWRVLAALPPLLAGDAAFEPLARYLEQDDQGLKRFQLALRIARSFDRYAIYRPDMVLKWEKGQDQDWQPRLWRTLAAQDPAPHIARLWRPFQDAMSRRNTPLQGLPQRLCMLGVSSLPPLFVDVLSRLARQIEVHLFHLDPCSEWWADIHSRRRIERLEAGFQARGYTPEQVAALHLEVGHPLLASLGTLGREFQLVLEECDYQEPIDDLFCEPERQDLLQTLQRDILHLRTRGPDERLPLDASDDSISIHSCHGALRQVQVLQDQLLQLFKELPDLQPRDVCVMMPDVEQWAPLVTSVFDRDPDDPRYIPFRVSDRSLRRDNPVAEGLLAVLELVDARVTASQVLDLLAHEPIRRQFGISGDDLEQLTDWVRVAGVRWGIDADHRASFGLPNSDTNTWRFGLDRLLLGVALPGRGRLLYRGVLPHDEIEGTAGQLLGRFVDFCETLFLRLRDLQRPRQLADWGQAIGLVLDQLLASDADEAWQQQQVRKVLDRARDQTLALGDQQDSSVQVLRGFLQGVFEESMPASGYLSGGVTFCAMVPMRSIPFRVVAMLGMDEDAYPRRSTGLGFDRMAQKSAPGDRSPREDDRTLFLEALLSARDRLLITFKGQDIRDNEARPPSVLVSELIDVLAETFVLPPDTDDERDEPARVRDHLLLRHPLQPFSPDNYGGSTQPRLFSYDPDWLAGAQRMLQDRQAPRPFFHEPLPPPQIDHLTLSELAGVLERGPVLHLMQKRLGLWLELDDSTIEDREPFQVDGLGLWELASPLLDEVIEQGSEPMSALDRVRASGRLPHGQPGACFFEDRVVAMVRPLAAAVASRDPGLPIEAVDVDLQLPQSGIRLTGTVDRVFERERQLHQFSKVRAKHLLSCWVHHLALQASGKAHLPSVLIGRPAKGGVGMHTMQPLRADWALHELDKLGRLYLRACSEPLPLFPESSLAYARVVRVDPDDDRKKKEGLRRANDGWRRSRRDGTQWGEGTDAHLILAVGEPELDYELRLPGQTPEVKTSFHDLAVHILAPMLAHTVLVET